MGCSHGTRESKSSWSLRFRLELLSLRSGSRSRVGIPLCWRGTDATVHHGTSWDTVGPAMERFGTPWDAHGTSNLPINGVDHTIYVLFLLSDHSLCTLPTAMLSPSITLPASSLSQPHLPVSVNFFPTHYHSLLRCVPSTASVHPAPFTSIADGSPRPSSPTVVNIYEKAE